VAVPPANGNAPAVALTNPGPETSVAVAPDTNLTNGFEAMLPVATIKPAVALAAPVTNTEGASDALTAALSDSSIEPLSLPLQTGDLHRPGFPWGVPGNTMALAFNASGSSNMMPPDAGSRDSADGGLAEIGSAASLTRSWPWSGHGWTIATDTAPALPTPGTAVATPGIAPATPGIAPAAPGIAAAPPSAQTAPPEIRAAGHAAGPSGRMPYVQVASMDSAQAAQAEWQRLQQKLPGLLGSHAPIIVQAEVNGRVYWRLRTDSFATMGEASEFCGHLQAAGSACWAVLAGPVPGPGGTQQ
jgi:hypothetical protein